MSSNKYPTPKPIILTAHIAAPREDVSVSLELPSDTTFGGLQAACLRALTNQAPQYSGRPISSLQYEVGANA